MSLWNPNITSVFVPVLGPTAMVAVAKRSLAVFLHWHHAEQLRVSNRS